MDVLTYFLLYFFILCQLPNSSGEAIRQCLCEPYEKCLNGGMKDMSLEKCFSKCEKVFPTSGFVSCMRQFSTDFKKLRKCSYSLSNGIRGCTSQKVNVLEERDMSQFRDYMISSIEDKVAQFDDTRQYMNKKAAKQGECLFECLYPGRNFCTRKLKCDIYLPPEDLFFETFYSCAEEKGLFSKSEQIYGCISKLMITGNADNKYKKY